MFFLDPDGPIDQLRAEMISLALQVGSGQEIIDLLRTDDDYVRFQARGMIATATKHGKKINPRRH